MVDLSFTLDETGVVEMPLKITGKCEGHQVLMQKVVMLMLASTADTLRYEGGLLYDNLKSANVSENREDLLLNTVNIAITEVVEIIKNSQEDDPDIPDDERLAALELSDMSLPAPDSLDLELTITSADGVEKVAALNIGV